MGRHDSGSGQPDGNGGRDQRLGLPISRPDSRRSMQDLSSLGRRPSAHATRMLNSPSVRRKWRESVSLRGFKNYNLLKEYNFRHYGVEDELDVA